MTDHVADDVEWWLKRARTAKTDLRAMLYVGIAIGLKIADSDFKKVEEMSDSVDRFREPKP